MSNFLKYVSFVAFLQYTSGESAWRFITLADWHGGESFVHSPGMNLSTSPVDKKLKLDTLKHLKSTYGGELMVLPGDSNGGHWHRPNTYKRINETKSTSTEDVILKAGDNCYGTIRLLFATAGYPTMLMTVGDHELGGNPWLPNTQHLQTQPQFRDTFQRNFNRDAHTGELLFSEPIGNVPSRPIGTLFENTSYAYRYKNVLFITLDAFQLVGDGLKPFWNKTQGTGGQGTVTCTIQGEHLEWFESVLFEARKDDSIRHIFVQAHVPVLQPVRKVNSSGQFMDDAELSEFWKVMRKYKVDVYLAGEVHSNTATKDDESDVVQIVSRGNFFNNFLTVDITDTTIHFTSYNEAGKLPQYNKNYEAWGNLTINKSGQTTIVSSSGSLELLGREKALIHFDFEEIRRLEYSRQVLGLKHDEYEKTLIARKITVRGIACWYSLYNKGSFGQQYDAQVGNLVLVNDNVRGKVGRFNETTRVSLWGLGPHSGGVVVSYSLYFKTFNRTTNMILIHMGGIFVNIQESKEHIMTLTLDRGVPSLYINSRTRLKASSATALADGKWHQVVVSMPRRSPKLSELQMYVDAKYTPTVVEGNDETLFFTTSGRMSIGGFGQSGNFYGSTNFNFLSPFKGLIDEVVVWGRPLTSADLLQ